MLSFILRHPLWVLALAFAVCAVGAVLFTQMKIDAYPDISGVQVQVITSFTCRAAEEVEQQVTIPIERILAGMPRAEAIRSRTIFGLSVVQVLFEPEVDDYWARNIVFQKLGEADLPGDAKTSLASLSTAYGEIFRYVINSDESSKLDEMALRELNDWSVIPRLLKVKGVVPLLFDVLDPIGL